MTGTKKESPIRVLGIAGSLRRDSYNRRLLAAARGLVPTGMEIEIFDLAGIPLYNGDLDVEGKRPGEVERLTREIAGAYALLFATPEYNHSIPGVLQNAIDWASRPGGKSVLVGKPAGILGASPGAIGTARAQQQLKLVLFSTLALVLPHPGVAVGQVVEKLGPAGELIHEPTREFLRAFLRDLRDWTVRLGRVPEQVEAESAAAQAG
jgi:chromate reductase